MNIERARAKRDAANDALREAWDIEDAFGPNEASDREIDKLRAAAEKADDDLAAAKRADVEIHREGSLFMVHHLTDAARDWVSENVSLEGWQWMGTRFACDQRYVENLVDGMVGDGLVVL